MQIPTKKTVRLYRLIKKLDFQPLSHNLRLKQELIGVGLQMRVGVRE